MTYEEWMKSVDKIVERICGLDTGFLPDWLSRDAYEDGLTPQEGAEECLESAGFYDFLDTDDSDDGGALASAGFGTDEDYGG